MRTLRPCERDRLEADVTRYYTPPQIAQICGCHRSKALRLATAGDLAGSLPPRSEGNPSPVWLIPDTPEIRARLETALPPGFADPRNRYRGGRRKKIVDAT